MYIYTLISKDVNNTNNICAKEMEKDQGERENENNLAPYCADVLFLADSREVAACKGTLQ